MSPYTQKLRKTMLIMIRKVVSIFVLAAFISTTWKAPSYGSTELITDVQWDSQGLMPWMPKPGVIVRLSPDFKPAHLLGMTIHPENALQFDFLIHRGDTPLSEDQKKEEYNKLVKYFLASLTIPDEDQWVNLSPYEKNRIVQDNFGKTEMGRDLLAQDYILKQITSSLIYPEDDLGKKFWDKVYERAWKEYGTTNVPVNTFNKVWIIPDEAVVYESGNTAYVLRNHLKVMLEQDYVSMEKHSVGAGPRACPNCEWQPQGVAPTKTNNIASQIVKEIILPELEKEVNEGQNFANLRQIYSGMILATWYKKALKESLLGQVYADKAKVKGVNQEDVKTNQAIYQQYLKAFKKGVFNYIKEDIDKYSNENIPRKYFSGGTRDFAQVTGVAQGYALGRLLIQKRGDPTPANIDPTVFAQGNNADRVITKLGTNQEVGGLLNIDAAMNSDILEKDREVLDAQLRGTIGAMLGSFTVKLNDEIMRKQVYWLLLDPASLRTQISQAVDRNPNIENVTEIFDFMSGFAAIFNPQNLKNKLPSLLTSAEKVDEYKSAFIRDSNRYLRLIKSFKETRAVLLKHKGASFKIAIPGLFLLFDKAEDGKTTFDELSWSIERFVDSDNMISDNKEALREALFKEVKKVYTQTQLKENVLEKTKKVLIDLKLQDGEVQRALNEFLKLRDQLEKDLKTSPQAQKVEDLPGVKEALAVLFTRDRTIGNILPVIKEKAAAKSALQDKVKEDLQIYMDLIVGFPHTRELLKTDEESWGAVAPMLYVAWADRFDFATKRTFEAALKAAERVGARVIVKLRDAVVKAVKDDLAKLKEDSAMLSTDAVIKEKVWAMVEKSINNSPWGYEVIEEARNHGISPDNLIRALKFLDLKKLMAGEGAITALQNQTPKDLIKEIDHLVENSDWEHGIDQELAAFVEKGGNIQIPEFEISDQLPSKQIKVGILKLMPQADVTNYFIKDKERWYWLNLNGKDFRVYFYSTGRVKLIPADAPDASVSIFEGDSYSIQLEGISVRVTAPLRERGGRRLIFFNENDEKPLIIKHLISFESEASVVAKRKDAAMSVEGAETSRAVVPVQPIDPVKNDLQQNPGWQERPKDKEEKPVETQIIRGVDTVDISDAAKGGIDLNSANLNLQIKRDGNGVPLPLIKQDMEQLNNIEGFVPVIIEIKPALGFPIFSELQEKLKPSSNSTVIANAV